MNREFFAATLMVACFIVPAGAFGYVLNDDPDPPTLDQAIDAKLDMMTSTESISFIPASGPLKGQPISAQEYFAAAPEDFLFNGVDPERGHFVRQVCTYYTKGGVALNDSPVGASICRQRTVTRKRAQDYALDQARSNPGVGRQTPAA